MSSKVLIFGINGFVGSYLSREFVDHGYDVYGSDRSDSSTVVSISGFQQCDLNDAEGVANVVQRFSPDIIVNLAAISSVGLSWKIPQETMRVNVVGTLNILEAVRAQSTPAKVMLIGSSEEYAPSNIPLNEESPIDATSPYGISKVTQERFADIYAQQYSIPIYKVRAFNHTGVGQSTSFVLPSWCKQVADIQRSGKSRRIEVGNTEVIRDFSDVRDIVHAYRLIVESEYTDTVFNVGSGHGYTLSELLQMIISFANEQIEVEVDPQLLRPTDNPVIVCDNAKVHELLGWQPVRSIELTLAEMIEFFMSV